jgi:D-alanyl-D-alanine carboxypeptidase/D-alanyl-D-alanine-endopeptidase (penicillin-binding protein 4)
MRKASKSLWIFPFAAFWLSHATALAAEVPVAPVTASTSAQSISSTATKLNEQTRTQLEALLATPSLADARLGVSIMALGKVDSPQQFPSRAFAGGPQIVFERDGDKRFMPASNMKLYTAALALGRLGADGTMPTSINVSRSPKDLLHETGRLEVPIVLQGEGDPSFSLADIRELAQKVRKAGITRCAGIRVDNSYLHADTLGGRYPDGWTLDDALWYYGPEVSGFAFNRNQVDVVVVGGVKSGDKPTVSVEPNLPGFQLDKEVLASITTGDATLSQKSDEELLFINRGMGEGVPRTVQITGLVAPGQKITLGVAVPNPALWAAYVLRDELQKVGVACDGELSVGKPQWPQGDMVERLGYHLSPPVSELLKDFLKPSDNLYGEMLLRLTALQQPYGVSPIPGTAAGGHALLREYLEKEHIDTAALRFSDGSGLSRYNLVTPHATAQLLAAAERLKDGQAFWDALPIAGVDGTLRRRMIGTPAQNNVRAKTGTFSIVSCLSGYVTTRDGTRLAVSILTNYARNGDDARRFQNELYTLLASSELVAS